MHRTTAEKKFARDLGISPSTGQQAQHFGLAWRQVRNADRIDMPQPDSWHAAVQLCSPFPHRHPRGPISIRRPQRATQRNSAASAGLPNSQA